MRSEQLSSYITQKGDTWDLISFKVYGSVQYVEELKKANYDFIKLICFPEEVALIIPVVKVSEEGENPEWF
ncbi:tail protein X [Cetobacterium sp. 2A]|uniref:tail protein X n=1 Tax=Cetobacterium sp. 2A TaxID=2754723 RepID=UPI00163BDAC8|nr:tail protein X [Cetobacterium sp. 2A]MBC2855358.1 tail protein X [Cetobacterium sp. 2A]